MRPWTGPAVTPVHGKMDPYVRAMHWNRVSRTGVLLVLCLAGCDAAYPDTTAFPGEPLPGLTPEQLLEFEAGRLLFARTFTPAEGLGPTFNEPRCVSCHDLPTPGGQGADPVRKATRFVDGRCDLMVEHGGDMFQLQIVDALRDRGFSEELVPASATATGLIIPPPLYGMGLIEAIPDDVILERADPDDADGDGISGRTGQSADQGIARFGRKAGFSTIAEFVQGALLTEMGLTSSGMPVEENIGGQPLPEGTDTAMEPEVDDESVARIAAYVRFLAPPAQDPVSAMADDSIRAGREVFEEIGCTGCHVPEMRTGATDVAPLSDRPARIFSDLLLHDMGPENASICTTRADPAEWRTAPLIGLRLRIGFLHDGRAASLAAAIRAHAGEGVRARDRWAVLTEQQQEWLMRFLLSL